MIIHKIADSLFSSQGTVKVLRVLKNNVIGLTGRQIAINAGITHQTAHNILASLESLKIVSRTIGGTSHIFILNRNNYLVKRIIEPLYDSEEEFQNSIFSIIKKHLSKHSVSLIVFGSVARNEETALSDLDLCVVLHKGKTILENKVNSLRDLLYREYGITLASFYITENEFVKRAKSGKPPVTEIIKEGKVLYGKSIRELM